MKRLNNISVVISVQNEDAVGYTGFSTSDDISISTSGMADFKPHVADLAGCGPVYTSGCHVSIFIFCYQHWCKLTYTRNHLMKL